MFKMLTAYEPEDFRYLTQMHNLRYQIFHQQLKWVNGLRIHSQMEFDQYDHDDALYLVRINEHDIVDACARLTPTSKPNLLGYTFADYIEKIEVPASDIVYEISRLCASRTAPRNIVGQLMACFLEFGLKNGIEQYVSLSDVKIIPAVKRYGWLADAVGSYHDTGTDISAALNYTVTQDYHDNVKQKIGLSSDITMFMTSTTRAEADGAMEPNSLQPSLN